MKMSNNMVHLPTAGLIVVKENKLLLAYSNNKKAWYLSGGKLDIGENSKQSLIREIREELNVDLLEENLHFYCHITAPAYGEKMNIVMEQDCFLYELNADIHPSNEIGAVKYFSPEMYNQESVQVIGVLMVFEKLAEDKIVI